MNKDEFRVVMKACDNAVKRVEAAKIYCDAAYGTTSSSVAIMDEILDDVKSLRSTICLLEEGGQS